MLEISDEVSYCKKMLMNLENMATVWSVNKLNKAIDIKTKKKKIQTTTTSIMKEKISL